MDFESINFKSFSLKRTIFGITEYFKGEINVDVEQLKFRIKYALENLEGNEKKSLDVYFRAILRSIEQNEMAKLKKLI